VISRIEDGSTEWEPVLDAVREACVTADGQDPLDEASSLRLKNHGLSGSALWLASSSGFALAHSGGVELAVAPEARGAGLGSELAAAAFEGSAPVTAWSHGDHPAAAKLASRHGLRRARELWVMRRPSSVPLPALDPPAGVTIRAYEPADESELLRVNAAAFAHHPEQGSMSSADLAERMAESWYSPAGLLVADAGDGTLRGFHWTKQHSPDLGEVYVVGIDPAAQGMGLGKVMTLAGLWHLNGLGVSEVLLYVESDNDPAVAVYSKLGFTHAAADTHVQYARP
jgi:mycothiol synthase